MLAAFAGCGGEPNNGGGEDDGIDIDFTRLSTIVQSTQHEIIMENVGDFVGQTMRIRGEYTAFFWEESGEIHHFVTLDCPSGCPKYFEFAVSGGELEFPDDYPDEGVLIEIVGVLSTYRVSGVARDMPYFVVDEFVVV
jgi:hypothetical protein